MTRRCAAAVGAWLLLLLLAGGGAAGPAGDPERAGGAPFLEVPVWRFRIVHTYPHDPLAYTQGLVYHNGDLLESTGLYGASDLRRVELKTGKVLQRRPLDARYFGEGLALFQDRLYQLTWREEKVLVWDLKTFEPRGELRYAGEGWGLAHDGESLIQSDGTEQVKLLDPATFRVRRTFRVLYQGRPIRGLNELEVVRGELYANVYGSDRILRIDLKTGKLLGLVELSNLLPAQERAAAERREPGAVMNGIAWDPQGDRLFVTGKNWPKLFEIRLMK